MQDVGRVRPQALPAVVGVLGDRFGELGELPLGRAPGEIGVGLGEAQLGQPEQARRAGERLGQEQHVGVGVLDLPDQPGPEVRRLGVRVVDTEHLDPVGNPVPDHPQHLLVEAGGIVVEVERVDVLVLLGRILRVGDGAVGKHREPLGVLTRPRVVGGALQRQVQCHLQALAAGGGDEFVEILDGAQVGVHGVMAALIAADRPGRSHVGGTGGDAVVAALAVHLADRVDGWQIDDVEAHPRDTRQRLGGSGERSVHGMPGTVPAAGRAGEQLVPRTEPGQGPIHPHAVLLAAGDQFAQRVLVDEFGHLRRQRRTGPPERVAGLA